jgi:hypothetical protein
VRKSDGAKLDISPEARIALLNEWFAENFDAAMAEKWTDSIGETIGTITGELRADFTAQLRKLELTVTRMQGELQALRAARATDVVVAAKQVGDAIEKSLRDFIDQRLAAATRRDDDSIIDVPRSAWRHNAA